jgi:valine dehydrogenase (NAD+)
MRAAAQKRWGDPSLRDRHVVVQGAGKVGSALSSLLVKEGATVAVADVDEARVRELVRKVGVDSLPVADAVSEPCDVLAPCALGSVVTPETIDTLHCDVICGGANNQLASDEMDDALVARDILYTPDFVANAGGILNIAEEFGGYSSERALASTARIEATVARVFAAAAEWGVAPGRAAQRMARERIAAGARPGGRWEPGDPAAWTDGQPLTRLRPEA